MRLFIVMAGLKNEKKKRRWWASKLYCDRPYTRGQLFLCCLIEDEETPISEVHTDVVCRLYSTTDRGMRSAGKRVRTGFIYFDVPISDGSLPQAVRRILGSMIHPHLNECLASARACVASNKCVPSTHLERCEHPDPEHLIHVE